jgi:hypothetical protein
MAIGVTLLIVGILIIAVWAIIEFKRMRHKAFAFFLIALILFTYFSFMHVVNQNKVDLTTSAGFLDASKLYFSWLGSLFGNLKSITANAINMDWSGENKTRG